MILHCGKCRFQIFGSVTHARDFFLKRPDMLACAALVLTVLSQNFNLSCVPRVP